MNARSSGFGASAQLGAQLNALVSQGNGVKVPYLRQLPLPAGSHLFVQEAELKKQAITCTGCQALLACWDLHLIREHAGSAFQPHKTGRHVLLQDPQLNDLHNVHDRLFQQQGQVSSLSSPHEAVVNVVC